MCFGGDALDLWGGLGKILGFSVSRSRFLGLGFSDSRFLVLGFTLQVSRFYLPDCERDCSFLVMNSLLVISRGLDMR